MSSGKGEYLVEDLERNQSLSSKDEIESQPNVKAANFTTKISVIDRFAAKLKAETKGIEPVTDSEKDDTSIWSAASIWFSANMVIAAFALGCLGPGVFHLNFWESAITIVFFSILGLLPVAFFSVFGVELGLRQMVLSRFLLGNVTARIFALINVIACIGWGVVNTVASAQLLHMVNSTGARCPPWAGCLIISTSTILVTFFGYRVIHAYEQFSWIPNFAVFLVIIARLTISGNFTVGKWEGGDTTAGNVLTFGGIVFGFASGWTTYAADYTVYMPRDTNKIKIFLTIAAGLMFPLCFTIIVGAAAATGTWTSQRWAENYKYEGVGGLVHGILVEDSLHGFGEFCCVLLAMSTVANLIPNMYSIALCTQAMWEPLAKVPRVFWTCSGNLITLGIAIPAYYKFNEFMSNFMDAISYYLGIYIGIALSEHFIYRKNFKSYNSNDWDKWDKLPIGVAGCWALFVGAIGVALGMAQKYWVGEIAAYIGDYGGDVGFELGFGFAVVAYNLVRPFEIKYLGR
ncbi:LANO_0D11166g1_1 [Lachancea nothofagi CBS 11611]|uniref:LANO_0D11166g1_1 n=1 Tax=Lachancea nothofagi CBS 11611 TaxID=1266666 RepID=A0A1G4JKY9_9SACH|nr:LANO_0D11166g1_1 [Lachancea nothofagi CBS 11611]